MSGMEARLKDMLDHHEIRKVLTAYCHACDRADEAMMAACYTGDNSFDDHGLVRAPGPEYARLMTANIVERTDAVWHVLGQSTIEVDGESARAETFFLGFMRLKPLDGTPRLNQLAGRFVDRLERIDGQWKIRHRTCVRDTSITLRVEEDLQAGYGLAAGTRDADDPGAALLGLAHHG
ncbi:MAG: nuclear transport factor 2 family protein [Novosphingobium sp.]